MRNPRVLQPPASTISFAQTSVICAARYDMAHRTLQDARAILELHDHLTGLSERGADTELARCDALAQELEAAKSM
eukprot:12933629-Prorocentrum_lima.AAC.1